MAAITQEDVERIVAEALARERQVSAAELARLEARTREYRKHGDQHRRGGNDPQGIIVEEADGGPSAKNVTKIIVTNAALTDNADGSVNLSTSGGGGSPLTVQEVDGTPSDTAVTVIRVPNGSLTDNGVGDVTLGYAQPGEMAALDAPYVIYGAAAGLPSAQTLTPGTGIQFASTGAGGTLTLATKFRIYISLGQDPKAEAVF